MPVSYRLYMAGCCSVRSSSFWPATNKEVWQLYAFPRTSTKCRRPRRRAPGQARSARETRKNGSSETNAPTLCKDAVKPEAAGKKTFKRVNEKAMCRVPPTDGLNKCEGRNKMEEKMWAVVHEKHWLVWEVHEKYMTSITSQRGVYVRGENQ